MGGCMCASQTGTQIHIISWTPVKAYLQLILKNLSKVSLSRVLLLRKSSAVFMRVKGFNRQNCPETSMYDKYPPWHSPHLFWGKQYFQSHANWLRNSGTFYCQQLLHSRGFYWQHIHLTGVINLVSRRLQGCRSAVCCAVGSWLSAPHSGGHGNSSRRCGSILWNIKCVCCVNMARWRVEGVHQWVRAETAQPGRWTNPPHHNSTTEGADLGSTGGL